MDSEHHDAAHIVSELSKEDDTNLVCEGEDCHVAPLDPSAGRPSTDAQSFEVIQEPHVHEESR